MVGRRVLNDLVKNIEKTGRVQIGLHFLFFFFKKKPKKDVSENILCPDRDFKVGHS